MIAQTCAARSAAFDMHADALAMYGQRAGLPVRRLPDGVKATPDLLSWRNDRVLFVQSMGPANLISLPLARLSGWRIVYYFHEPTALARKLRNGDPLIKAVAMQVVQWSDNLFANRILVSRDELRRSAHAIFRTRLDKIHLAPLLLPEAAAGEGAERRRITYLGRPDRRRFIEEFVAAAPELAAAGFRPTILTGDPDGLARLTGPAPEGVDVRAQRNFPEALKAEILGETRLLWNPKRGEIAQSGVTADALRFGIPVLLTAFDPQFKALHEAGLAIDYDTAGLAGDYWLSDARLAEVRARAGEMFSRAHGFDCFTEHYLPLLRPDG